jgi:hypothetical protein
METLLGKTLLMKYWTSYHIYWDTKIDKWYGQIMPLLEQYFINKSYGSEIEELNTFIICSIARDTLKKSKVSRKEKILFLEIVIPYEKYMGLSGESDKKKCIATYILHDMELLSKYKAKDFNFQTLKEDFQTFFENIGWL